MAVQTTNLLLSTNLLQNTNILQQRNDLLVPVQAIPPSIPYTGTVAFVAVTPVGYGPEFGTGPVTTAPTNTTGADFITIAITSFDAISTELTVIDSFNNTWTPSAFSPDGGPTMSPLYYHCLNPRVGTGHTFTVTATTDGSLALAAIAFKGVISGAPENPLTGNTNSANLSISNGNPQPLLACTSPQTPANVGDILVAAAGVAINTSGWNVTSNGGYTIAAIFFPNPYVGIALFYKIAVAGDVSGGTQPTFIYGRTGAPETIGATSVVGIYAK